MLAVRVRLDLILPGASAKLTFTPSFQTTASTSPSSPSLQPALSLALDILDLLPSSLFTSSHHPTRPTISPDSPEQALHHASAFYSLSIDLSRPAEPDYTGFSGPVLFQHSIEGALRICSAVAKRPEGRETTVVGALRVLKGLLDVGAKHGRTVKVEWEPESWFHGLSRLLSKVCLVASHLIRPPPDAYLAFFRRSPSRSSKG